MTKIDIIKAVREETIGSDNKITAAIASRDLWLEEIKRAQEAVEEANERITILLSNRLHELNLKAMEGELIYFPEYDISCFWANDKLHLMPPQAFSKFSKEDI